MRFKQYFAYVKENFEQVLAIFKTQRTFCNNFLIKYVCVINFLQSGAKEQPL